MLALSPMTCMRVPTDPHTLERHEYLRVMFISSVHHHQNSWMRANRADRWLVGAAVPQVPPSGCSTTTVHVTSEWQNTNKHSRTWLHGHCSQVDPLLVFFWRAQIVKKGEIKSPRGHKDHNVTNRTAFVWKLCCFELLKPLWKYKSLQGGT